MSTPIIQIQNVSKSFGSKLLLDSVSFDLNPKEITTLIGQNGAGKTTIAKLLLGLEEPSSGNIVRQNGLRIGYVPQKLDYHKNMPITCKALLKLLAPAILKEDLVSFQDFLDYKSVKNKDISKISGGQLQKLLLIGTVLGKPDILILDEPTQYLDVASQQEFYRLVGKFREEMNMSIFMISHDLFTVMKNSDRVICLNKHVCCSGKPSEFSSNKELKSALSEIGLYVHHHDHEH